MSLQTVTEAIRNKVGEDSGLGSTLKLNLGDDGVIVLDGTAVPNTVTNNDTEAACTVSLSLDDLEAMMRGDLDPMAAFSLGKLQLDGDMGVAMKLGTIVGG